MNLYGCIKLTFTNIQEHSHLRVCMNVFYLLHGWCASLSEQKSNTDNSNCYPFNLVIYFVENTAQPFNVIALLVKNGWSVQKQIMLMCLLFK